MNTDDEDEREIAKIAEIEKQEDLTRMSAD
jgi:hypothetical protein